MIFNNLYRIKLSAIGSAIVHPFPAPASIAEPIAESENIQLLLQVKPVIILYINHLEIYK